MQLERTSAGSVKADGAATRFGDGGCGKAQPRCCQVVPDKAKSVRRRSGSPAGNHRYVSGVLADRRGDFLNGRGSIEAKERRQSSRILQQAAQGISRE